MSNLRPAPFFLRPSVVRALIHDIDLIARAVKQVPLLPIKLVDEVRSEPENTEITRFDPRHPAPVNDDQDQKSSSSRLPLQEYGRKRMARRGDVSLNPQATVDREEASPHPITESTPTHSPAADRESSCATGLTAEVTSGGVAGGRSSNPANVSLSHPLKHEYIVESRRSGKTVRQEMLRQAQHERDEPTLEVHCHRGQTPPIAIIRAAAAELRQRTQVKPAPRPLPGVASKSTAPLSANPVDARRERIARAIAFLAARGVPVCVRDRLEPIRHCWVTGKRDAKLADEVIAIAAALGMNREARDGQG